MSDKRTVKLNSDPGQSKPAGDEPLKGTFVSVLLLGGFLILTWLGVFILFIYRN